MNLKESENLVLSAFLEMVDIYGEPAISEELVLLAAKNKRPVPRIFKWSEEDIAILRRDYPEKVQISLNFVKSSQQGRLVIGLMNLVLEKIHQLIRVHGQIISCDFLRANILNVVQRFLICYAALAGHKS